MSSKLFRTLYQDKGLIVEWYRGYAIVGRATTPHYYSARTSNGYNPLELGVCWGTIQEVKDELDKYPEFPSDLDKIINRVAGVLHVDSRLSKRIGRFHAEDAPGVTARVIGGQRTMIPYTKLESYLIGMILKSDPSKLEKFNGEA